MAITSNTFTTSELVTAAKMNSNVRDNWTATWPTGTEEWQDWSPSYANLTTTTGTVVARYAQIGKTVRFFWSFVLGASSAVGTAPTVSLPVTAAAGAAATGIAHIGTARLNDANAADWQGFAVLTSTTVVTLVYMNASAQVANISNTAPFTWVTTDALVVTGTYEAA